MSLTDGELTVLGLLAEQPRHGYDLEKVIDERGMRTWTSLGFSSIYYVLDKLAKRGLIETTTVRTTAKGRASYQLTSAGRTLCAEATREALTAVTPIRARVLIGMANSPGLPDADVIAGLTERLTAVRSELAALQATRARQEPLPPAASAIFAHGEAMLNADAEWTDMTLASLTKDKYDIKKAHKTLYAPSAKDFTVVDVPEIHYLAIDGHGDPNTSARYADAVEALYSVAYKLKFASKALGRDFVVAPLEGLWRSPDPTVFLSRRKDLWHWTMMISQPPWITPDMVRTAVEDATSKRPNPALPDLRLHSLTEGRSVQILHIGPYDAETPTLQRLHDHYLPTNNLTFNGDHHEIYLSDPRKTPPPKLKTILRQPVKQQSSTQRGSRPTEACCSRRGDP